jgi:Na+/H+ antiporter
MENFTIIIFILAVLISLSAFADRLKIPHPVLLVLAGLVIGIIPGLPELAFDPEIIFLLFLPPLLYDAAFRTSWHDFKTNIKPISALGISLVFLTTIIVAVAAYSFIPDLTWPMAFLLGAIISPPDAVAATGIIKGLHLNKRVITILEGESLINDASALIAYRYALAASITGSFVLWKAGLQFLWVAGGGVLVGLLIGYILVLVHKKINNHPTVETSLTLLSPFLVYVAAERVHTSGILATVSAGLLMAWRSPEIFAYQTRMRTKSVWDTLVFLLNGFIFILMGLQLPVILKQLTNYKLTTLIVYGLIISLVTILVRILWVFAGAYLAKSVSAKKRTAGEADEKEADDTWKNVSIVAWTGTRGVISMATALALPVTLYNGEGFPQRHLIIFVAFVVIFVTLVVQGFSLPALIRLLGVKPVRVDDREEKELQLYVVNSTLHFIENGLEPKPDERIIKELNKKYEQLVQKLTGEISIHERNEKNDQQASVRKVTAMQKVQVEIARFQRDLLLQIHKEGRFNDIAIKQVERDLDIDELKLNQMLPKKDH